MYFKADDFRDRRYTFPTHQLRNDITISIPLGESNPQPNVRTNIRKKRSTRTDNNNQPTFNIPGLEKIMHSPNCWHKFVWLAAVLAFYGLCIYQLVDRITLYFHAPIALDITIETVSSVEFPSVTICPSFSTLLFPYKHFQLSNNSESDISPFLANNNLSLDDIWNEFRIAEEDISVESSCSLAELSENNTNHQDDRELNNTYGRSNKRCEGYVPIVEKPYLTFWGTCLLMTPVAKLSYRGAWTFIKFKAQRHVEPSNTHRFLHKRAVNDDVFKKTQQTKNQQPGKDLQLSSSSLSVLEELLKKMTQRSKKAKQEAEKRFWQTLEHLENEIVFIPHARDVQPTHELAKVYYRVNKGKEVMVSFHLKKFSYLNTKKNPCVDQKVTAKCKQTCLEYHLNETVPCRLPYMKISSLTPCDTFKAGDAAQLAVEKVYKEFDNCYSPRSCVETLISFISDFHAIKRKSADFYINYPDNGIEVITERFSYTFSSLLSDIGGNLGFCVGLCLFSFVEFIMTPLQLLSNRKRNKSLKHIHRPLVVKLPKYVYPNTVRRSF